MFARHCSIRCGSCILANARKTKRPEGFAMMVSTAVVMLLVCPASEGQLLPSVAVLPLDAKDGVKKDVATQLTDHFVDALRNGGAFKRVVSASEVRDALGFE